MAIATYNEEQDRGVPYPQCSLTLTTCQSPLGREKVAEVITDFDKYARLSGANLNVAQSAVLPVGTKDVEFSPNVCVVSKAQCLGLRFNRVGIETELF